jgi:hypothetical protein
MGKLGEFIIKQLEDKKVQRWIISSDDFFILCTNMGIIEDDETMMDIMDYLEENNIDVNFHNAKSADGLYRRWREVERKLKLREMLKGSKTETQKLIEKVDSIKVKDRPNWLEMYRDDEDNPEAKIPDNENPFQRITDMLTQELRDRIENEPGISIEEFQEQIDNEILNNNNNN